MGWFLLPLYEGGWAAVAKGVVEGGDSCARTSTQHWEGVSHHLHPRWNDTTRIAQCPFNIDMLVVLKPILQTKMDTCACERSHHVNMKRPAQNLVVWWPSPLPTSSGGAFMCHSMCSDNQASACKYAPLCCERAGAARIAATLRRISICRNVCAVPGRPGPDTYSISVVMISSFVSRLSGDRLRNRRCCRPAGFNQSSVYQHTNAVSRFTNN